MKLLGWMNRKLRQNSSSDASKDFPGGGTCSCLSGRPAPEGDHNQCQRRNLTMRSLHLPSDDHYGVGGGGGGGGEQAMDKLWGGLLAIGTMGIGSDPVGEVDAAVLPDTSNEEEKPAETVKDDAAIAIPDVMEEIAEKATTVTDLMEVTAELEKVLAAEAGKTAAISSARPSYHVGSGAGVHALCPLQGFLFGSPIELAETTGRRKRRASLGELFMRSRIVEEGARERGKEEALAKLAGESADFAVEDAKSAAARKHVLKRMLKRRGSKGSDDGGALAEASATETRFHKILHIFNRKVHPDDRSMTKRSMKLGKNENKGAYVPHVAVDGHISAKNDALTANCNGAYRKEIIPKFSFHSPTSPSFASNSSDSSGHREHWIKTDADYLVLEF